MKKNKNTFFLLIFFSVAGYAQRETVQNLPVFDKKKLHWGYFFGTNSYGFKIDQKTPGASINTVQGPGFNVGLIGDMRINEYLNLRLEPGLYYTKRTIYFNAIPNESDSIRDVPATYIHIPLLLKFSSKRVRNFRPYLVGGISTSLNLASNEKNPDDNSKGQFRMKRNTFYYEIGFGIDFYLFWFKFSPSIRGCFALNNELVYDKDPVSPWTSNIDYFGSRAFFINLSFE